jgi:hypothetical protein
MNHRTAYLYSALAILSAMAFGLVVGPYWVDDAMAIPILSVVTIIVCMGQGQGMKAFTRWWAPTPRDMQLTRASHARAPAIDFGYKRYIPRSKIAHFALLSQLPFRSASAWDSYSPFERKLLSRREWQKLSTDELKAISESQGP